MPGNASVTQLLGRYQSGDRSAWDQLIPILYEDLRRLARQRLRHERHALTLGTTALVNECYLRLIETRQLDVDGRNGFLAAASETMRRVIVDYARTRNRLKRGGGRAAIPIEDVEPWLSDTEAAEVLAIDEALDRLQQLDARAAKVIELRFFVGLSLEETARVLDVSVKTVQRTWLCARAWLRQQVAAREDLP